MILFLSSKNRVITNQSTQRHIMKKTYLKLIALISTFPLFLSSCSNVGSMSGNTNTHVDLVGNNYKMIKAGASGSSTGFELLGFLPIIQPSYAEAKSNLYNSTGLNLTGRAVALANQTDDKSNIYLILFSIPKVTLTADVVEFTGKPNESNNSSSRR
jgi:hypothetical protein